MCWIDMGICLSCNCTIRSISFTLIYLPETRQLKTHTGQPVATTSYQEELKHARWWNREEVKDYVTHILNECMAKINVYILLTMDRSKIDTDFGVTDLYFWGVWAFGTVNFIIMTAPIETLAINLIRHLTADDTHLIWINTRSPKWLHRWVTLF